MNKLAITLSLLLGLGSFIASAHAAPMVIGWAPVCKYNPNYGTAQCQYQTYDQCLNNLGYGEVCLQKNQLGQ